MSPLKWRGWGVCLETVVMRNASVPLLVGRDIMEPEHLSAAWGNIIKPLCINTVIHSQSKKAETVDG